MFNARFIQGIIIIVVGVFLAIWLGLSIVTEQVETLLKLAGAMVFIAALFLGRRVWLLLILFSAMNVVLYRGFGTTDIGQVVFLAFCAALFLLRKLPIQFSFGELELWALLIIVCIVQTYMRNPVGLNLFGGSNVGGRPYIVLALAISTAAVLSNLRVEPKELKWAMGLTIFGGFLGIPGTFLRYGNLNTSEEGFARIPSFAVASQILARWLSSIISPLRACIHPLWGVVLFISLALAAGSGYRNSIAAIGLVYFFGTCYRGGIGAIFASLLGGAVILVLLAFINLNAPLPGNIQRALSPLPGTWEKRYVNAGEASTEWRIEMWKEALTSERWIRNKIFGDGMGMTSAQLQQNERLDATQIGTAASGLLVQQENMLVNGSYHSGPVHSIRAVGYVGLAILLLAMIRVAMHAHRQIRRCQGTEWHSVALFFGIPLLIQPIFFTFIFGEFQTGVAGTMMGIAMIRLLEKNIPLPAWKKAVYQPFVVRSMRNTVPSYGKPA